MPNKRVLAIILIIITASILILSCSIPSNARPGLGLPSALEGDLPTPTALPTFTPTPAPKGSLDNPVMLGVYANGANPNQAPALDELMEVLKSATSLEYGYKLYPSYFQLEEASLDNAVDFTFLGPVEYILAEQKGLFAAGLITTHAGVKSYGTQFFAHKDSDFQTYYDATRNESLTSAAYALQQLSGTKGCFISEKSLAGYWVPMGYLVSNNIEIQTPVFTESSSASLRSLYIKGVCQFATTYSSISDPRTASTVINDLNDIMDKVPVIWASPAVIPNSAIVFSSRLEYPISIQLNEFLVQYSNTVEGRSLFSNAFNYEINGFSPITDAFYDDLRGLLAVQDLRYSELIGTP